MNLPRTIIAAAVACALTPAIASADTPPTPCTPTNTTVLWDPALASKGLQGQATGVQKIDGVWTFLRCEITLDPANWATISQAERCELVVHELIHLARVDDVHAPSGVMAHVPGWFDGCRTVRDRVRRDLLARWPAGTGVICGKGTRVFYCRTFSGQREARYRVRVTGAAHSIRRVRSR